jgi:hypothetical protein
MRHAPGPCLIKLAATKPNLLIGDECRPNFGFEAILGGEVVSEEL